MCLRMYTHVGFKLILTIFVTGLLYFVNVQGETCFRSPNICPNENVTFWLYTRDNLDGIELNIHDFKKLDAMLPDKEKNVKILIHGYTSNRNDAFNNATRKALLEHNDFYTISVNWTPLTKKGCREISSLNTRVVGNCTAHFIDTLVEHADIPLANIHAIGFSLGAQCTGFISSNLKNGKLTRISGLDPTLPYFNTTNLSERLDSSDAEFVDVYHTASGIRSQIIPCGHIDVYFNDGQNQPGCDKDDGNSDNPHICSHKRSFEYYGESITSKVGFNCIPCKFENDVQLRTCDTDASLLCGYHVLSGSTGVHHIKTASKSPFAVIP